MTILRIIAIAASVFVAGLMVQNVIAGIVAVETATTSHEGEVR